LNSVLLFLPLRNLLFDFKVFGHALKEAISRPSLSFIVRLVPYFVKALLAVFNLFLSASVNAQLLRIIVKTPHSLDLKLTNE